jgi:uncharacterized membrane protein YeaQ/YmgE (transglycosylase-associated protein family)
MDILGLTLSLISGALGGNVAGAVLQEDSLGTVGNSIAGIVGGVLVGAMFQAMGLGAAAGAVDPISLVGQFLGGALGGGILMFVIGLIRIVRARA